MTVAGPARSYLDYNATAPLRPEARAAMIEALDRVGNPSSVHGEGRWARRIVEEAREAVAAVVGARPEEIVFTSGGTEANALALLGGGRPRRLTSAIEHPSVLAHATHTMPVDRAGILRIEGLATAFPEEEAVGTVPGDMADAIVSVMLANNETGVLQPVERVAILAHDRGALVHTDAIQAAAKINIDFNRLQVDLLTLSGHKLGGPMGVGALVVRDGLALSPVLAGGGQERRRRGGTENLPGIAGFGAAARAALSVLAAEAERLTRLRDRLETDACDAVPDAVIHGRRGARLPNTSCIGLPGMPSETQVMNLDLAGVAVSAGSACSSGKVTASHVLAAMGVSEANAGSAIRVSLGWATTDADVDRFVDAWGRMAGRRKAA